MSRQDLERDPEKTISIRVKIHLLAFGLLLFFTALNGLYNVLELELEQGGKHALFLPPTNDRQADLIEAALSMPPFGPDFVYHRDEPYSNYYGLADRYRALDGLRQGRITALNSPPMLLLLLLFLKKAILWLGPVEIVHLYYITGIGCVAFLAAKFRTGFMETLFVFCGLALSYPFLFILSRGNAGALITSMCLIFFLRELIVGRRAILAALLLALAVNWRPNVVLLAPLFLIFGARRGGLGLLIFGLAAAALGLTCFHFDRLLYPGYGLKVFLQALHIYFEKYAIGKEGSHFNNSAYGAVWPVVKALHMAPGLTWKILHALQLGLTFGSMALTLTAAVYYLRRQIDKYEYAFVAAALYILGSTIVGTYHLFFFTIFILLLAHPRFEFDRRRSHYLVVAAVVLLLIPKNYIFINHISLEVMINPLLLAVALGAIWWRRARLTSREHFWDTLRWEMD